MPVTGAHIKAALGAVGAGSGLVASADQLAAGADEALARMGVKNAKTAAMFLATMAQESAYFRTTTEYGAAGSLSYDPYRGRTFEQLTHPENYLAFGAYAKANGLIQDGGVFTANPSALSDLRWAWLGGVYYWTAKRAGQPGWGDYNSLLDVAATGNFLAVSRAVNAGNPNWSGTPNGWDERQKMFNAFLAFGAALLPSTKTTTTTTPTARPGEIPGSPGQVINAAKAALKQYGGRYYGTRWPGLAELGRQPEYWCADFDRWVLRKAAGYDLATYCPGYAYTPAFLAFCIKSPLWTEVTPKDVKGGEIVLFQKPSGLTYHTGIVIAKVSNTAVTTIEGNTSTPGISESMSNGGTVAQKTRSTADAAFYRMRIFRPTYVYPVTSTTDQEPDTPVDAPVVVVVGPPTVGGYDMPDVGDLSVNPVDALNVSEAFRAALLEGTRKYGRIDAYLGTQVIIEDLPFDADSSNIRVSPSNPVRRNASITVQPDVNRESFYDIFAALSQPGVTLRVETGVQWGETMYETVPIHYGLAQKVTNSWPQGTITINSPDNMQVVASRGFTRAVCSDVRFSYVDMIRLFTTEVDPGSQLVDLTGNTDLIPDVIWQPTPTSRVDAVMQMAAAIGAELFASPVPHVWILRPIASLYDPAQWTVAAGENLISREVSVDWSKAFNTYTIIAERADSATLIETYKDTDSDTGIYGPRGEVMDSRRTSLLTDRDQLLTMGKALVDRSMGARIGLDLQMLGNPLIESGDRMAVLTERETFQMVVDEFTYPLGKQRVSPASARSIIMPGDI